MASDPAKSDNRPWPSELKLKKSECCLVVSFDTGEQFTLPAELLRVESPSAEVQGHGSGQKTIVAGKRNVTIEALEPVGNYAVRIIFGDGHDSGLFTWDTLYRLGSEKEQIFADYIAALTDKGLSRD